MRHFCHVQRNHPDFKHRAFPDGGDYDDFLPIDMMAFTDGQIGHILDAIDSMSQQYQDGDTVSILSDESNLKLLESIKRNVLDIKVMNDWFWANHDIAKAGPVADNPAPVWFELADEEADD